MFLVKCRLAAFDCYRFVFKSKALTCHYGLLWGESRRPAQVGEVMSQVPAGGSGGMRIRGETRGGKHFQVGELGL